MFLLTFMVRSSLRHFLGDSKWSARIVRTMARGVIPRCSRSRSRGTRCTPRRTTMRAWRLCGCRSMRCPIAGCSPRCAPTGQVSRGVCAHWRLSIRASEPFGFTRPTSGSPSVDLLVDLPGEHLIHLGPHDLHRRREALVVLRELHG